jgi:ABC-type branched-subunit amino acid transport system ATPase component
MGNKAVLEVDIISKTFGGVVAVWEVSFHLQKGELLGIIGPNGSGKTTLVNLLTGFVKPDSGKVTYLGKNITGTK